jgi:nucleotide-binding universal stress UspA family protein
MGRSSLVHAVACDKAGPVTGPRAPERTAPIVVGVDHSPESMDALRWAADLARRENRPLEAVVVWLPYAGYGISSRTPVHDWDPLPYIRKELDTTVEETFGPDRPEQLRTRCEFGKPAEKLIALSESAHLLVLGNKGRSAITDVLLGSVSAKCAARARCPVVIVHAGWSTGQAGTRATQAHAETAS